MELQSSSRVKSMDHAQHRPRRGLLDSIVEEHQTDAYQTCTNPRIFGHRALNVNKQSIPQKHPSYIFRKL
ncbi:hypothetical protein VTP01DRAFT_2056 [Rhizomucor pusillus]|uniref:uncharacterized protein n=1 Tax=Rhizomucor pusillus TaxID=4840 RepID=UPI003743F315